MVISGATTRSRPSVTEASISWRSDVARARAGGGPARAPARPPPRPAAPPGPAAGGPRRRARPVRVSAAPPRLPRVPRPLRRKADGTAVVAVRLTGRAAELVAADLVEGVVA